MKEKTRQQIIRAASALISGADGWPAGNSAVYAPCAVQAKTGCPNSIRVSDAIRLGATGFRVSAYEGTPTPWAGLVAKWPQHYWE